MNVASDEFVYISNEGLKRLNQIWSSSNPNKHLNWTVDYTVELPIRLRKQGEGKNQYLQFFYFLGLIRSIHFTIFLDFRMLFFIVIYGF